MEIQAHEWVSAIKDDLRWLYKDTYLHGFGEVADLADPYALVALGGEVSHVAARSPGTWARYFEAYRVALILQSLSEMFAEGELIITLQGKVTTSFG